jgi:acetyl-CoA C-acetyltransferase
VERFVSAAAHKAAGSQDVVIIGVGQLRGNRQRSADEAREPLELIQDAALSSAADAGLGPEALAGLDSVDVVQIVSWDYKDAAADLAARLGAPAARCATSGVGGHQPVAVLTDIAARLSRGEGGLALLCGGEAQSSVDLLTRLGSDAGWTRNPGGPTEFPREVGGTEAMWDLALVGPIRVYPLWENRLRYELGQSFEAAQDWSGRLYSEFSAVAAANDTAWDPTARTPAEITAVTDANRMICYPYPLRMNANPKVDQAAAILIATAETADELGVPPDRRIHVWSAATASDCEDVLERESYGSSPGLNYVLDQSLELAGLGPDEVGTLDIYSCFPIVPKLAELHLGAAGRALSVTGGLSSFGGPHNDYSSHALVAMARALRERGGTGLVYANGEYLTMHAAVVLSAQERNGGPRIAEPQDAGAQVTYDAGYAGPVEVETFSVEFGRDGVPVRGCVVGRTPTGGRTAARVAKGDAATLAGLVAEDREAIGRTGRIELADGRRQFALDQEGP